MTVADVDDIVRGLPTMSSEERVMRAREVLAAEYEATAPAGKYVARDIRNGILSAENERTIRAMLAFADAGSGIGKLREARASDVTQADRDAAGSLWRDLEMGEVEPSNGLASVILETMAYAFAAHRVIAISDIDRSGLAQEVD